MKTWLECVKEAASVRKLKDDVTRFYFELPNELIKALEDAADLYATQSNSHKPGVMQGLPTEEDIRAAGLKLTAHLTVEPMLRDMAKRYFRQGARWAISNMSGSPTVGKEREDASVSDGK